jgi:hypothetical protein
MRREPIAVDRRSLNPFQSLEVGFGIPTIPEVPAYDAQMASRLAKPVTKGLTGVFGPALRLKEPYSDLRPRLRRRPTTPVGKK